MSKKAKTKPSCEVKIDGKTFTIYERVGFADK